MVTATVANERTNQRTEVYLSGKGRLNGGGLDVQNRGASGRMDGCGVG